MTIGLVRCLRLCVTISIVFSAFRIAYAGPGSHPNPTTTGASSAIASSTSTSLGGYENGILIGVFPARPIVDLSFHIQVNGDYGEDDPYCEYFGPGEGPKPFFYGIGTVSFQGLPAGRLDASQAIIACTYFSHGYYGPLRPRDYFVTDIVAHGSDGQLVRVGLCDVDWSSRDSFEAPGPGECRWACGDAICDGRVNIVDALAVLKTAVAAQTCSDFLCDTNHDGDITSTDAMLVLRRVVGSPTALLCGTDTCLDDSAPAF